MKTRYIKIALLSFCLLHLFACKKAEPLANMTPQKFAKLELKGLVLNDTLVFVLDGQIVGTAIDGNFRLQDRIYTAGKILQVLKKADGKAVGEIRIAEAPYNQVRKIFYDGTTFTDKVDLTPVSDPNNMGVRLRFTSTTNLFYDGPVDVEFMIQQMDMNTYEISYIKTDILFKNVTNSFGEFVELPPLSSTDTVLRGYVIVVYKTGTNEPPYKEGVQLAGEPDPDFVYGSLDFRPGDSQLLSVSDMFYSGTLLLSAYSIEDLSTPFK